MLGSCETGIEISGYIKSGDHFTSQPPNQWELGNLSPV
jgi:hypothetical protein